MPVSYQQLKFCCLMRFFIVLRVHGAFSLPIYIRVESGFNGFLLRKYIRQGRDLNGGMGGGSPNLEKICRFAGKEG